MNLTWSFFGALLLSSIHRGSGECNSLEHCLLTNVTSDGDGRSEKFPEWSWDRVRTYVAIRRGDDYSDEQIRALAAQDVVMLEKMNGHETHGSVEKGTGQSYTKS